MHAGLLGVLLVALLLVAWWSRPRACSACVPRAPRANVTPLTLLCDEQQFRRASAAARWPEELRRRTSPGGDHLCVALGPGAELLPDWDAAVRARARRDELASHPLRPSLRALASARACLPLPLGRAGGKAFACPDPRLLVGSEALVEAALPLAAEVSCLSAFRLGLWVKEAELRLRVPEREWAYLPAADGDETALRPSASELRAALQELGGGGKAAGGDDVVLPAL
jgi:hypothetical protein